LSFRSKKGLARCASPFAVEGSLGRYFIHVRIALKLFCSLFVAALFVQSAAASPRAIQAHQSAQSRQQQRAQTAKVKAAVHKRGTGEKARVKLTLYDKTKLQGYITKIGPDSFAITDRKTHQVRIISYSEVKRVQSAHW
jgi:Na+-transporting NADH:ubiquinone oxidoreductase subunit NqrC